VRLGEKARKNHKNDEKKGKRRKRGKRSREIKLSRKKRGRISSRTKAYRRDRSVEERVWEGEKEGTDSPRGACEKRKSENKGSQNRAICGGMIRQSA